jgi:two-component system, chemotaxis family, protein-glutamate methylesterase/glutaminase
MITTAAKPLLASRQLEAVVIGASAGGIEALSILLPALPSGLAAPVFVVQHLTRERPSLLVELFQARCRLTVCEALDNMPIEQGVVYFAPPDYHLLIDNGHRLALSVDAPVHYSRPSIDVLFESAADHYGAGLLGMLLTGANQDGAAGLKAVHDHGGQTIVQDPSTAPAATMPNAALGLDEPDFILDLNGIAALLAKLPEKRV